MPSGKPGQLWLTGIHFARLCAGVDDDDPTAKPPEIGRGRQTGGAAADYETVARSALEDWVVVTLRMRET